MSAAPVCFSVAVHGAERIDRFLADQMQLSRTVAARLIGEQCVCVGGVPVRASFAPPHGTRIEVAVPDPAPRRVSPAHDIALSMVHEDDDIAVVDKPAGLVVHPAPGHWDDTLINALAAHGLQLGGGAADRPGIIHRLDKDTSGLIVVAKSERAHRRLATAMAARKIVRRYAALAWGHMDDTRRVEAPLGRHPGDRKRMAVRPEGRAAATTFRRVARGGVADLLQCTLETGRTHQIRVHLQSVGHPVIGDAVYGGAAVGRSDATRAAAIAVLGAVPRQALHAAWLQLPHPATGELLDLRAEWPADLRPGLALAIGDEGLLDESKPLQYLGFFDFGHAD